MATMKAVRIHSYGGADVLSYEDAPRPVPAADEVLIRVHAAGVNPLDWKVRAGYLQGMLNYAFPVIIGTDVSGVVEEAGADVTGFQAGDAVYGYVDVTRAGAYAEYVAVPATMVVRMPQSLDHVQAAAVPLGALTAWQSLFDTAELDAGQTVLIHGAAGGVGTFAIQLAKLRGARVVGTASGHNLDFLRQLGADEAIDYTTTRFEEAVRDVDLVLDAVGGETTQRSWGVLKRGGMLISLPGQSSPEIAAAHGVRQPAFYTRASAQDLTEIAGLIDAGQLKPIVGRVFPLQEARHAHELSESGHARGKIVLRVAG